MTQLTILDNILVLQAIGKPVQDQAGWVGPSPENCHSWWDKF